MKLSTWIFLRNFEDSVSDYNIIDGTPTITGFRLFLEDDSAIVEDYLYVSCIPKTLHGDHNEKRFRLSNKSDWITIKGYSYDALINEILAVFERYNSWESALSKLTVEPDSLNKMIEISQPIFNNPIAIMDTGGHMLAISTQYDPDDLDNDWKYICEHMTVPPSNTSHEITDRRGCRKSYWTNEPQIYLNSKFGGADLIGVVITEENEECGALSIYGYLQTLGEADLQLSKVFASILCRCAHSKSSELRRDLKTPILTALLEGNTVSEQSLSLLKGMDGIPSPWKIAVFKNIHRNDDVQRNALLQLSRLQPIKCLPLIFDGLFVFVASESNMNSLLMYLERAAGETSYCIGVSLPFCEMRILRVFYNQAKFALTQSGGQPDIYLCENVAFERLLQLTCEHNDALILSHPALEKLKKYDTENDVQFYETLYQYLINERSIKVTSDILFIHRNSLLYRIERIKEIIGTDLEDTRERLYILFSFLLEHQSIKIGSVAKNLLICSNANL